MLGSTFCVKKMSNLKNKVPFRNLLLVRTYYKNAAYICSECNAKFKPKFWGILFRRAHAENKKAHVHLMRAQRMCVEAGAG